MGIKSFKYLNEVHPMIESLRVSFGETFWQTFVFQYSQDKYSTVEFLL